MTPSRVRLALVLAAFGDAAPAVISDIAEWIARH
jgi:hypothetical protein